MPEHQPQFVIYARIGPHAAEHNAGQAIQKASCLREVSRRGGSVVGEYVDCSDCVETGRQLERLMGDLSARGWRRPKVIVDHFSRISRDMEVVRYISRCIHDLDGELVSCSEPNAAVQGDPRWPASTGHSMLLEVDDALDAAKRFGATIASHIRVECPFISKASASSSRGESCLGSVRSNRSSTSRRSCRPRDGIEMLKWLTDYDIDEVALENAFVDGLVGELLLQINVRSGK